MRDVFQEKIFEYQESRRKEKLKPPYAYDDLIKDPRICGTKRGRERMTSDFERELDTVNKYLDSDVYGERHLAEDVIRLNWAIQHIKAVELHSMYNSRQSTAGYKVPHSKVEERWYTIWNEKYGVVGPLTTALRHSRNLTIEDIVNL